jgi:hypothetical protein
MIKHTHTYIYKSNNNTYTIHISCGLFDSEVNMLLCYIKCWDGLILIDKSIPLIAAADL